jgi:hypothetical protein
MLILAYCITDANSVVDIPSTGIAGEPLEAVQHSGLSCLISRFHPSEVVPLSGQDVALAFHRVLQRVFAQAAIIPFRFPTTVQTEQELRRFLDDHGEEYREALFRLRDRVQMEVRIAYTAKGSDTTSSSQSGGEYLRHKQQRLAGLATVAEAVRSAINTMAADWRERASSQDLRLFALVARSAVVDFESRLAGLKIDSAFVVRVSGPWPATEFLHKEHAQS